MIDAKEVIKFFRVQLNRCKINLKGANDRNDKRAADNIKHKMEIYDYVIDVLQSREE